MPQSAYYLTRSLVVLALFVPAQLGVLKAQELPDSPGSLEVADDFVATLFADDDLCHDVYCMTTDSQGRIVVSGQGYIRILIDEDNNGVAESAKEFVSGPKSGAQGMWFEGSDLYCIGDGGLLRYTDRDGDDKADGPPQNFLELKTGGEHNAHAIRRGPDGWWYLICGNTTGIDKDYATLKSSPIKQPRAGTILRLKPDLSGGEIFVDGFRNAYDFDFSQFGEIFSYDSDGERDISLPWYRPTRVFHSVMASDHGWVSRSWKRPNETFGGAPVVAELGRGSPTGVVCYRHARFPAKYQGAFFVLDWTYGEVDVIFPKREGATWTSSKQTFLKGEGSFGFAPTDVCVGKEGALYVSVGGRGTRGGVYRITSKDALELPKSLTPREIVCTAPQPNSSWSRAIWVPIAKQLGRGELLTIAREGLPNANSVNFETRRLRDQVPHRIRAIEIVTEFFGGLDEVTLIALANDDAPEVRARAAWSWGRVETPPSLELLKPYLQDSDPLVVRCALESLMLTDLNGVDSLIPELAGAMGHPDRVVRDSAVRISQRLGDISFQRLANEAVTLGWHGGISTALGLRGIRPGINRYGINLSLRILEEANQIELRREAVLLLQSSLGTPDEESGSDPVFDGYTAKHAKDLTNLSAEVTRLEAVFPTGHAEIDHELVRAIAMLAPGSEKLFAALVERLSEDSHPVDDIHHLIALARFTNAGSEEQQQRIANALVRIQRKIDARQLPQDRNWEDRVSECVHALTKSNPVLMNHVVGHPDFGRPSHVVFLDELDDEQFGQAIEKFVDAVRTANGNYQWTPEVVFVFGEAGDPALLEDLRGLASNYALRSAVLMVLSAYGMEEDRDLLFDGLNSVEGDVVLLCAESLASMDLELTNSEQAQLVGLLTKLHHSQVEYQTREIIIKMLQESTGKSFGFVEGAEGYQLQQEVIAKWTAWAEETLPPEARVRSVAFRSETQEEMLERLPAIERLDADLQRGEKLFETKSCLRCHNGRKALGPDLSGVGQRFSNKDLMISIVNPSRDVSPRYQTTLITTLEGKTYSGLVVYESIDGLLLRDAMNRTFRIEAADIELRETLGTSLMPAGLLNQSTDQEIADLLAYLKSLN